MIYWEQSTISMHDFLKYSHLNTALCLFIQENINQKRQSFPEPPWRYSVFGSLFSEVRNKKYRKATSINITSSPTLLHIKTINIFYLKILVILMRMGGVKSAFLLLFIICQVLSAPYAWQECSSCTSQDCRDFRAIKVKK